MPLLQLPRPGGGRLNGFRPGRIWSGVWTGVWGSTFALEGVALGFFVAAAVALITHKCTLVALHRPLPGVGVICFAPFVFIFDTLTLVLLHEGLARTSSLPWRILAGAVGLVIVSSSATFVSLYMEAKAELDWEQALEVNILCYLGNCRLGRIGKCTARY